MSHRVSRIFLWCRVAPFLLSDEITNAHAVATLRVNLRKIASKGQSLKRIAYLLNAEGVKSPQPQKGRVSQSWCVSSVRHILRNRRYKGQIIWNTKRKVRVPGTGRRIYRRRPESEWVVSAAPHLRIVSDDLFATVEQRFAITQRLWGAGFAGTGLTHGHAKQVYLFSGLLTCGEWGGALRWLEDGRKPCDLSTVVRCTRNGATRFARTIFGFSANSWRSGCSLAFKLECSARSSSTT